MVDDHKRPAPYDSLLAPVFDDEGATGWMVSYIDVMTLLVALFVVILSAGKLLTPERTDPATVAPPTFVNADMQLGVPLPKAMVRDHEIATAPRPRPGRLSVEAISAALGVAGLPARSSVEPPALLALPTAEASDAAPAGPLPRLALASSIDLSAPLADYLVILTDQLPAGVEEAPEAGGHRLTLAAREVAQAVASAPYLPNLEGVEVSRVPEGVRLRVEDRLLFPTAQAELSDAGMGLVAGRLGEVVARHPGEVAVQGHTDSRPIRTPRFPSNWALSSARAIAIVEALVGAGIDPARLRAVGLADTRPLASNATAEGRARNRRVEVVIQTR